MSRKNRSIQAILLSLRAEEKLCPTHPFHPTWDQRPRILVLVTCPWCALGTGMGTLGGQLSGSWEDGGCDEFAVSVNEEKL